MDILYFMQLYCDKFVYIELKFVKLRGNYPPFDCKSNNFLKIALVF